MSKIKKFIYILLSLLILINYSCNFKKITAKQKINKAIKVEERQKKEYEKARKKEIKRRYKIQSEETKKMMKETAKKSKNYNKYKTTINKENQNK